VLVLSRFAGAAEQMGEALLVNPFSREELSDAIKRALTMPLAERRRKWECLMQVVRDTDVGVWRDDFVSTLRAIQRPADDGGQPAAAAPDQAA
ncbi:MAG: trehalose-6-phosphate synthase, partial [Alphaproteobacteria bacterium]|nr:trehalose-6-phosphate synthase [Alphaproteobacteria bacterium]